MSDKRIYLDDIVYFLDKTDYEMCYGIVTAMKLEKPPHGIILTIDNVKTVGTPFDSKQIRYGKATIGAEFCFKTVSELKEFIDKETDAELNVYRKQINSVEDLLNFVLAHDVSGEGFHIEIDEPNKHHDIQNRRTVFVEKAAELLGVKDLQKDLPTL